MRARLRTEGGAASVANFSSGTTASVVLMAVGVVATPWILRLLGAETFGAARALTDVMAYAGLLELGLAPAMRSEIAMAIGKGDDERVASIVSTGLRAYLLPVLMMLAAGLALTLLLPRLIPTKGIAPRELYIAGLIAMGPSLLVFHLPFRMLAEATNRAYLPTVLISMQLLLATALALLFARLGWGLVGQAGAQCIAQVPVSIAFIIFAKRQLPAFWKTPPDDGIRRSLWRLNWHNLFFAISGRLSLLSDNLIVSWMLGAAMVTPFYLTQRLFAIGASQLQQISSSTWAPLAQLYASGEGHTFRRRFLQLSTATSGLGIATLAVFAAYNQHFLSRWVGAVSYGGDSITLLAAANAWLLAVYSLWAWPFAGCSKMDKLAPYAGLAMAVNVAGSYTATRWLGSPGPLVGTLLANLFVGSWSYTMLLNRYFGIPPKDLWQSVLGNFKWGMPFAAFTWIAAHSHVPRNWGLLAGEISFAGACGFGLWWSVGINGEQRSFWKDRTSSVVNRFRAAGSAPNTLGSAEH